MRIVERERVRVLIEDDMEALQKLSDLLMYYATVQPWDPVHFNDITKATFLRIFETLNDRIKEQKKDYNGEKYVILAKGRRKLTLGLKREPDLYIGSEYGTNFIEACHSYFFLHPHRNKFNERKLTYYGRSLFGLLAKDVTIYESGITTASGSYSVWFKILGQTYNLASKENKADAELQSKMLIRAFEILMTLKPTKHQKSA